MIQAFIGVGYFSHFFKKNVQTPCAHNTKQQTCTWPKWVVLLSRLGRVFCCCSIREAMDDYKEGYLMVWTNCISPCNSICWALLWGYLWRHISYRGNVQGPQKCPLNFSLCKLSENLIRWPTIFISLLESSLNYLTFKIVTYRWAISSQFQT